ncbi:HK97 family phage prohead protease [Amycolatopsis sp. SID8362]|uniref:HK97 family phage prohead protease n=1 Tax=Amycolatopsis sp. SID8362 TaxID=2690346 RepID=UPI00136EE8A0|nr:HK97 family phage prohead protease [Amycolatopsis sp. SID8362]NBH01943.1 HK97 family phage prohead protease [Amycolatopsis sp. SID8362]NED38646.1 HK97 family phage prohead protease [Amycolatopsis sp. SID8362]
MTEMLTRQFMPELEVRSSGDGRTITGIAVPYGRPQYIDSRLTEQFARGAFNAQLRAAHRIPFMRDHGPHGGNLIGKANELRDDAAGLYGEWRVSKTPLGDETLELVKDGALSELSIGFREGQNRTLSGGVVERRTATLTEVAIVMAGAYGEAAMVASVRAQSTVDRRAEAAQILAQLPVLSADAELLTRSAHGGSNLKYGPGSPLWRYWTGPEGFARYAGAAEPWTTLRDALLKEGVPATMADGLATNVMQATPAGRALFASHHGKHA